MVFYCILWYFVVFYGILLYFMLFSYVFPENFGRPEKERAPIRLESLYTDSTGAKMWWIMSGMTHNSCPDLNGFWMGNGWEISTNAWFYTLFQQYPDQWLIACLRWVCQHDMTGLEDPSFFHGVLWHIDASCQCCLQALGQHLRRGKTFSQRWWKTNIEYSYIHTFLQ